MSKLQVPSDAETYIRRTRDKASQQGQTRETIEKLRDDQIKDTLQEVEQLRAKKLLDDVKKNVQTPTTTVISQIFAGKTPDEITAILEHMSPEGMQNLVALASKLDQSGNAVSVQAQPQQKDNTQMETILSIVRLMKEMQPAPPPQKDPMETALAIVKLIKETNGSGNNPQKDPLELIKTVQELNRPFYENLGKKDKELMDLKLKEIEAKQPPDLLEQLKYVKEASRELGIGGSQTSENDLRLEEMKENREIDMKRLDWEQRKYEMEQDADSQKWEQITKILQGPIGQAIQGIGNAGADRVRGSRQNPNNPKPVQTQCPNCGKSIYVDADALTAVCGSCGAILQRQGTPTPPQQQPAPQASTHVDASPEPSPPATSPSQEGNVQEEDENGPDDEEGEQQPEAEPSEQ